MEQTDFIESADDVDALVEVESDEFHGLAETTFDVSNIAQTGDKVVILHFNEETQGWEFVAEETVDENGNVTADFSSYSPVAFVVVKTDGTMTPANGATHEHGDYIYTYDTFSRGWSVAINTSVTDKNQTSYGSILESIDGEPVTDMPRTFRFCESLVTAPEIPSSVTSMSSTFEGCNSLVVAPDMSNATSVTYMFGTFSGCKALTTVPVLPENVTVIKNVFNGCKALATAPVIPASVTDMFGTFWDCTSLTGTVTINANPTSYGWCFRNVDFAAQNLTLAGTSTMLDAIGADGSSNYCNNCNGVCVE